MSYKTELNIKSAILNPHDGYVNRFVAISHALELAASKEYNTQDIAEVLTDCLNEFDQK